MGRRQYKDPVYVRWDTFALRVNAEERQMISELATWLQRSQSDAVRFVVVNAVRELETQEQNASTKSLEAVHDEN